MKDKGYLLFAIDNSEVDYSILAYACALTIKLTQPDGYNNVTVVTNVKHKFDDKIQIFDNIIEYTGPIGMDCRSRAYELSPYQRTVLLDSDMLFLKPMDHYWNQVEHLDLFITSSPQNYKGKSFSYGHYRKVFVDYDLPDVYNAWTYFRKSKQSEEFFELVKLMTDNPDPFIKKFLPSLGLNNIPTDEAFALSLCILGLEDQAVYSEWDFPRITHMKPLVQGWKEYLVDWTEKIRFSLDQQGQIKLGVWQQTELLHYVDKNIITSDIIKTLESAYES
jgi:hypothetical protein